MKVSIEYAEDVGQPLEARMAVAYELPNETGAGALGEMVAEVVKSIGVPRLSWFVAALIERLGDGIEDGPLASADFRRDARRVIAAWQEYDAEREHLLKDNNYDQDKLDSAWDRLRTKKT